MLSYFKLTNKITLSILPFCTKQQNFARKSRDASPVIYKKDKKSWFSFDFIFVYHALKILRREKVVSFFTDSNLHYNPPPPSIKKKTSSKEYEAKIKTTRQGFAT